MYALFDPSLENPADLVPLKEWEEWLHKLVMFLERHEKQIDTLKFLEQVKQKIEDCSRSYTGMWVLETLHQSVEKHKASLKPEFLEDVQALNTSFDILMYPIREQRKELLGVKCTEFFYTEYKDANKLFPQDQLETLGSTWASRWLELCKHLHDKGITSTKEYQKFAGKMLVEMVKY
jgi:hypothetical protein